MHGFALWANAATQGEECAYHLDYAELHRRRRNTLHPHPHPEPNSNPHSNPHPNPHPHPHPSPNRNPNPNPSPNPYPNQAASAHELSRLRAQLTAAEQEAARSQRAEATLKEKVGDGQGQGQGQGQG